MPPAGFEPTIPVSGRPKTYALDRAATGIGRKYMCQSYFSLSITPENVKENNVGETDVEGR